MPTTLLDIERMAPLPLFREATLDEVHRSAVVRTGLTSRDEWQRRCGGVRLGPVQVADGGVEREDWQHGRRHADE